jgi:hypothetical protein
MHDKNAIKIAQRASTRALMYCQRRAPPLLTNWAYGDVAAEDVGFGVRNRGTKSDVAFGNLGP